MTPPDFLLTLDERFLFHVTRRKSLASIMRHGLLPWMDRRKKGFVWLAELCEVTWAMGHICGSREWRGRDMVVLLVPRPDVRLQRVRQGIWKTRERVKVDGSIVFSWADFVRIILACHY